MSDVHPMLAEAFDALHASGARWCLLRGRDRLATPQGDVDLLFHPDDSLRAGAALESVGFVMLRRWAGGTQNFFLAYHRGTDQWIYVHAVAELGFGEMHSLVWPGGAEEVLLRATPDAGLPVPSADDAFWITLLHALADKGRVADRHRDALRDLAPRTTADAPAARFGGSLLPDGVGAPGAIARAASGDADGLTALAPGVVQRWRARDPTHGFRRASHRRSLRATKLREIVTRRGVDTAILAPDGAGKSTVIAALEEHLFFRVRTFYLGLEGGRFAGRGRSRVPLGGFVARLAHAGRSWWAARYHLARRRLVLYDRYPYEGRLPETTKRSFLSRLRRGLLARCLPAPDLVVVLDAPGDVLHRRKAEHPAERLERDRQGYLALARRYGWTVVDATRGPDEVRADVTDAIWRTYRRRVGGR